MLDTKHSTGTARPILVTGSHRSGSTWVGKMLALSSDVTYVHEPFNPSHRPGICNAQFAHWFTYICHDNEALYAPDLDRCLQLKYNVFSEFRAVRSRKDVLRLMRDCARFAKDRLIGSRPLIKDPIAVFSAEWLAERYDMEVVALVRHPAAFAGSLKKASWSHPFDHFLRQPLLMEHHLAEYRQQIEEYSQRDTDIVDQAILLWNVIHSMILKYRQHEPGWIFLRHEDLSRSPTEQFRDVYDKLGLEFSPSVQRTVGEFSRGGLTAKSTGQFRRDSKRNISTWKKRLSADEIERVKEHTSEIASEFYSDEDWTT